MDSTSLRSQGPSRTSLWLLGAAWAIDATLLLHDPVWIDRLAEMERTAARNVTNNRVNNRFKKNDVLVTFCPHQHWVEEIRWTRSKVTKCHCETSCHNLGWWGGGGRWTKHLCGNSTTSYSGWMKNPVNVSVMKCHRVRMFPRDIFTWTESLGLNVTRLKRGVN